MLPILLLMFGAVVDFGMMFQRYLVVNNAAREGARIAVLPGYTLTDVQNRVTAYVRQGVGDQSAAPTTTMVTVTITPAAPAAPFTAAQVTVSMSHTYLFMGPLSGLVGGASWSSITLFARATMRIES